MSNATAAQSKRRTLFVTQAKETELIQKICYDIDRTHIHPSKTCLLMVSPDYSATAAMMMAHDLTKDREMLNMEAVHVPYPDEQAKPYIRRFNEEFPKYAGRYQNFLLVEAGIISGKNYTWLTNEMKNHGVIIGNIATVAVYENVHSIYKSDYVGEYYDNETQDLTYWWERPNKHWDNY